MMVGAAGFVFTHESSCLAIIWISSIFSNSKFATLSIVTKIKRHYA